MAGNEVFKALADPTRRNILRLLRGGELTAGEIADRLDARISKPSVSHHFAVLKSADLITARREGQQIYYALNTTVVQDLLALIWDLFPAPDPGANPKESES
jgi:ArsR family transcriptional regulator, arsenate/arsenite/antimonite-responsive transcriptional repressor